MSSVTYLINKFFFSKIGHYFPDNLIITTISNQKSEMDLKRRPDYVTIETTAQLVGMVLCEVKLNTYKLEGYWSYFF